MRIAETPTLLAFVLAVLAARPADAQTLFDQALGRLLGGPGTTARPTGASPVADGRTATGRTSPVSTFDVASIRLGDSDQQVRAALARNGYAVDQVFYEPGFEDLVRSAVAERNGTRAPFRKPTLPGTLTARGPNGATIEVLSRAVEGGSSVREIRWRIGQAAMAPAAFMSQAIGKYGQPSYRENDYQFLWCQAATARCGSSDGAYKAADHMWMDTTSGSDALELVAGTDAERAAKDAVAAEVDRRAPRTDRAAF